MMHSAASAGDSSQSKLLRIGVIGCGRVAAHHLRFISQAPGAVVAGLADQNETAARELGRRYQVDEVQNSLESMLERVSIDVVHILTPPSHHYRQALAAIERGIHVIVEKPMTFEAGEAEHLYRRAAEKGVLLCPDFIQLFHPAFLKARAIVESGQIGPVVSVESYLSESLDIPEFREARGLHWSFHLPGGVLHNLITHPLYLALYFLGEARSITVIPKSFGALPQGVTDHLEILIDATQGSAHVVVSHAVKSRPTYFVRVFCEHGVVSVNFDTSTVVVARPGGMPRSIERATANFSEALQLCRSGVSNIFDFVRGRLVPYQGLQELIPQFYGAVRNGTSPPISSELAKTVVHIEEQVFSRVSKLHIDLRPRRSLQTAYRHGERVLVTGAAGYLGNAVVRLLVREGYAVRAMVRPLSHIERLEELGIEIYFGDVRDLDSLMHAAEGMDIVVHAAAGLRGSTNHIFDSSVVGTQNVAEASLKAKVRRVIYISSLSVYDFADLKKGDVITEDSPLDDHPELAGTYALAKRKAEDVALAHLGNGFPSWTILRPSVLVGQKDSPLGPIDAFQLGNLVICMSSPNKNLCVVHVEDVAEVILRVLRNDDTQGRTFVVHSPERVRLSDYIRVCVTDLKPNARVIYVPYWFARLGVGSLMVLRKVTGKGPTLNLRRLAVVYRELAVQSKDLTSVLNWEPRQSLLDRLKMERHFRKPSLTRIESQAPISASVKAAE